MATIKPPSLPPIKPLSDKSNKKKQSPLLVRLLFHPMLYIAILVHAALLAIPGGPEEELPPEVEEDQEIEITMLPAIIEPDPEVDVELIEEEAPPTPEPLPPPPAPEPIQEQEQLVVEEEPEEESEEPAEEDSGEELKEESEDEAGEQPTATTGDLSAIDTVIRALVQDINRTREETRQVEPSDATTTPRDYRKPANYFVDAEIKRNAEFKDGILQNDETSRVLVRIDDIDADTLFPQLKALIEQNGFVAEDVSERLSEYNPNSPSRNDFLLALKPSADDPVSFYLALAKMRGQSVTIIPWSSTSFQEE